MHRRLEQKIKEALAEIIATYGVSIMEDTDRLAQFLEDRCGELREEIFLLTFALRYLLKAGWSPRVPGSERSESLYVDGLANNLGMSASTARGLLSELRRIISEAARLEDGSEGGRIVASAGNLRRIAGGVANKPRTMWLRKKSMRNGLVLLAVLASIAVLLFQIGSQRNPVGDELRVAFMTRMTGPASQTGLNRLRAAQLAVESINKQGGIRGYKLKVVGFDLPPDAERARKTFESIVKDRSVLVAVCGVDGAAARAIAPIADTASVPLVMTSDGAAIAEESGRPYLYVFGISSNSYDRARMMAHFMVKDLQKKKAAVLYELNADFTAEAHDQLLSAVTEMGGEIVADVRPLRRLGVDHAAAAKTIKDSGAEALLIPGRGSNTATMIAAVRAAGFTAPIIGENYTENIPEAVGKSLAGSWWINEVSSLDPQIRSALRDFRSLYNENVPPGDVQDVLLAYDTMIWIARAFYTAPGYRGEAIRHALLSTKNFAVTHATLTIDPRTHTPYKKAMSVVYCENETGIFQKRIRGTDVE